MSSKKSKKAAKKEEKFPETVFVAKPSQSDVESGWVDEDDYSVYSSEEQFMQSDIEDGQMVAVYQFIGLRKVSKPEPVYPQAELLIV